MTETRQNPPDNGHSGDDTPGPGLARRRFLASATALTAGLAVLSTRPAAATAPVRGGEAGRHWAMAVDLCKCIGCQACTLACMAENRVSGTNGYRTTVAIHEIAADERVGAVMLPRLCNHCDDPPCLPVCPTGATFRQRDGVVVVDADVCVGCGYCVQACPYDARFISADTGTADKCTFCAHRVGAGLLPACVETCVGGARVFGDLNDPAGALRRLIDADPAAVRVLRPDRGTRPNVFYLGLDERFADRVPPVAVVTTGRSAAGQAAHRRDGGR